MTQVVHYHDRLSKLYFQDKAFCKQFLATHLPKDLQQRLNLDTLEIKKTSFVDEKLREYLSDVLYSVNRTDNHKAFMYFLIESESNPTRLTPFKAFEYVIQIMRQSLIEQEKQGKTPKLPLVYPILYVTSEKGFNGTTDLFELFDDPELARQYFLKPMQLIDLAKLAENDIAQHDKAVATLEIIQHQIHYRDAMALAEDLLVKGYIRHIVMKYGHLLLGTLKYIIERGQWQDSPQPFLEKLIKEYPEKEKDIMLGADYFRNEGIDLGRTEGIDLGRMQEKKDVAMSLLTSGKLPLDEIAEVTKLSVDEIEQLQPAAEETDA